jgi:putative ABC transport system substrate-binding protein
MDAFRVSLRELGYVEGKNIIIEERWASGQRNRFETLIEDLLRANVDVLVVSSVVGAHAAKKATTKTPVVFVAVTDPVGAGVVSSLARPGGNLTGTSFLIGEEFASKWVELMKDTVPRISRIAALHHTDHPMAGKYAEAMEKTAKSLGLTLQLLDVKDFAGLDRALSMMATIPADALIVPASPLFGANRRRIAEFAVQRRIPTIGHDQSFAVDGVLLAYGPSIADTYRRGAVYVDKILKGAKPADLPVEQPTKFELIINLKTAKTLGLTIPPSLLARADQVIE